ncbi:unnamed protein product [Toxocara canis]|uniref:Sulfatase domain-containing protein n=1 Tax=Toxocara canis TaxID=6265 RepID=A0A183U7I6_TOXCA|nr:unnamed protein product [Toxocara canis]
MNVVDGSGLPPRSGLFRTKTLEKAALDGGDEGRVADALQKSGMQPLMLFFPAGRMHRPSDAAFLSRYLRRL